MPLPASRRGEVSTRSQGRWRATLPQALILTYSNYLITFSIYYDQYAGGVHCTSVLFVSCMYLDEGMGGGGWLLTSFFSIIYILGLVCYKHTTCIHV